MRIGPTLAAMRSEKTSAFIRRAVKFGSFWLQSVRSRQLVGPAPIRLPSCPFVSLWQSKICSSVISTQGYKKLSYGRETARSLILFRLTSSVIRKIMHKIGFLSHPMGASGEIYALYLKCLTKRNLLGEFIERMSVLLVKQRISVSEPPLGA